MQSGVITTTKEVHIQPPCLGNTALGAHLEADNGARLLGIVVGERSWLGEVRSSAGAVVGAGGVPGRCGHRVLTERIRVRDIMRLRYESLPKVRRGEQDPGHGRAA